jgi:hypothetical protein
MKFSNMFVATKNRNDIPFMKSATYTKHLNMFVAKKVLIFFWNILQFVFEFSAHAGSDELWAKTPLFLI